MSIFQQVVISVFIERLDNRQNGLVMASTKGQYSFCEDALKIRKGTLAI